MKIVMFRLTLFCACLYAGLLSSSLKADSAQALFEQHSPSIYQILLIEQASDKKSSIGSGFQIDAAGLVASNFHVISSAVHEPEKYRIEYLNSEGERGAMSIVDFDIVHDLALLRLDKPGQSYLALSSDALSNGEDLFSMGNPLDLGLSIVKGTYNGLIEKSFYQKILFSGSLNPGMSGGPTLNETGQVMGVNVSTAGNEISFLVPIKYLEALVEQVDESSETTDYASKINGQLLKDQDYKFSLLLEMDWPEQKLGPATVAGSIEDYFKCWGDTRDKEDLTYRSTDMYCLSQDSIYISGSFNTGKIDYQYSLVESDELNQFRFYNLYKEWFGSMYTRNGASKEDATNYQCQESLTYKEVAGEETQESVDKNGPWKTVFCVRRYKEYPDLYDALFSSAYLGESKQGFVAHIAMSGVSMPNAMAMLTKFMETYRWQ